MTGSDFSSSPLPLLSMWRSRARALMLLLAMLAAALFGLGAGSPALAAGKYQVGVYYYPGWSPEIKGPKTPDTWNAIRRFPDREPELGWYHDGKKDTLDRQLKWMVEAGIDFSVFDWYWENGRPAKETSVRAYLASEQRKNVKYALLWANHTAEPRSLEEWDALSDFWIANHLKNPEYLKVDGKPALIIFSPEVLNAQAKVIGKPVSELLDRTREKARKAGLAGVYFVLCVPAVEYWVRFAPKAGFDAITAYNYHFGVAGDPARRTRASESFDELDQGYRMQWNWILANSKLPYFVPMTSGWDRHPWSETGLRNKHDDSMSTPPEFETHLRAGRSAMDEHPDKTKRMGIMCCWNEYGEGSYIEPTKRDGKKYLERVRKVFGGDE